MEDIRQKLIDVLMHSGIAVVRTDTLYGIIARANDETAVERVYAAKGRNPEKSCIVLIADPMQAYGDISAARHTVDGPTSVLVDSPKAPEWLLRANNMIAHRIPDVPWLAEVIREVGPVIAPSANPEGMPPAMTVDQAKRYFGQNVDLYVDGGTVPADTPPSKLIHITEEGTVERLR
jgi:L-threonylcarbamoyladenylate synthase